MSRLKPHLHPPSFPQAGNPSLCLLIPAGLLVFVLGCMSEVQGFDDGTSLEAASRPMLIDNGMTPNGLSTNGLSTNGLSTNGLSTNGLSTNGLSTAEFTRWFLSNPPEYSNMVMRYVVACAYPRGQSLTWSNGATLYTWHGLLGLTPGWASGDPATELEQQLISACLAAHVNKFGLSLPISLRGHDALNAPLPLEPEENTLFAEREAAFFGNLFTDEGIYVCNDRTVLNTAESSARACGLSSQASGMSVECPPMVHLGSCGNLCKKDKHGDHYTLCTYKKRAYRPLTTRIRSEDIYRCGDGVCQVSESCDSSSTAIGQSYNNCQADCGDCASLGASTIQGVLP